MKRNNFVKEAITLCCGGFILSQSECYQNIKKLSILLLIFGFISCDEAEELTEIDFDATFTEQVTVTLTDSGTTFSESLTINLADNSDVADYLDNLESINITNVSYEIMDYVGVDTATGEITADAAGQSFGPYQHDFFTNDQNNTIFPFQETSQLNTVANSFLSNNQLTIVFSGTQDPAQNGSFVIEVTLDVDVTAQAL